jgi:vacuolar-type H+-ATPase subunit C/Vma6
VTDWSDVVVRTKGLSAHLLKPVQVTPLCTAMNVGVLGAQMAAMDLVPTPPAGTSLDEHDLELALRRRAGARLRIIARWAGPRLRHLAPLYDDEDRRALRALVRGAVAGAPPDERLRGLIPTVALPVRALEQLSRAGDLGAMGALLLAWRHPFGAAVADEAARQTPDLFRLETAITRTFAERARRVSRGAGAAMRLFVRRSIDLENLWAALVVAGHKPDADPAAMFVEGGAIVTIADMKLAADSGDPDTLAAALAPRVHRTPLAAALYAAPRPADEAALEALVVEFKSLARSEPLGLAPVIHFALRQRAELRALLRIIWSVAMGIPAAEIAKRVRTAA